MDGQTLEHPEGRTTEPQHCPKCGRFLHLQYHAIMEGRYQFSKYLCLVHGETLKQLEEEAMAKWEPELWDMSRR